MTQNELSTRVEEFEFTQRHAKMLVSSGFFPGVKDVAQAAVKMEIAKAFGLNPIQGLMGIHSVQGRLVVEASNMAAVAKRAGYEFVAISHTNEVAKIAIFNAKGMKLGESEFSMADAATAGLKGKDNWTKYPKNMLWARAMANACRWFCSDAFGGPVYVPEELEEPIPIQSMANGTHKPQSDEAADLTVKISDLAQGQVLPAVKEVTEEEWAALKAQTKLKEKRFEAEGGVPNSAD